MTAEQQSTNNYTSINEYNRICVSLACPNDIRSWSYGEVRTPETINYRTYRPEKDGLFCERIFGPERDWECSCGKFKGIKYKDIICDRCGVKVTHSKERRKRMGHINLSVPVVHIWFFHTAPSRLGTLLDIKSSDLRNVVYFKNYIVVDPKDTPLKEREILSEDEFRKACDEYGGDAQRDGGAAFTAKMGAEAVRDLIRKLDLEELERSLTAELQDCSQKLKREGLVKRLRIVQSLRRSGMDPMWMILDVIPVIPPDLRPLVPLESGNFATSDLNDLYRRVIYRNNRLAKLLELNAPNVIVRNEKRMLQQAVDALFDNSRCKRPVQGAGNRPLKSLTDMIKGKQGRFRANLLGKRVDYSARSVIIVGPELKLDQVGLPKKIALELFQPFIIRKLKERGLADTIKSAKTMLERKDEEIWDVLEEVIEGHPVLLNRAPTLHRMGIQAFYPVLVEGEALRLHPLVCAGFNADFDGDQMAVHLPLTIEAQAEASMLMLSTANIFSPAHGNPVITADLDIVLGCYYLTLARKQALGGCDVPEKKKSNPISHVFRDFAEAINAYDQGKIAIGAWIRVRAPKEWADWAKEYEKETGIKEKSWVKVLASDLKDEAKGGAELDVQPNGIMKTTVGRIMFYDMLPRGPKYGMKFYNYTMNKKSLNSVVSDCHLLLGRMQTIKLLDSMKETGFHYATVSGVSFSTRDLRTPAKKWDIIKKADEEVANIVEAHAMGDITAGERTNQIIEIWGRVSDDIAKELMESLSTDDERFGKPYLNPVWAMFESRARGSAAQIRQLAGIRGLMSKPGGEIIETPIKASFREGLRGLEYFSATHGARKGLADTALKTADSGYLTRKLVEVSQDCVISAYDCGTENGLSKGEVSSGDHVEVTMAENIFGRVTLDTIKDPKTGKTVVSKGDLITREKAREIESLGIGKIRVRSPLTCECDYGICAKCYGMDLSTGKLVEQGLAVGIIAAQSIGEPGTQLTMRTFHIGGVASTKRQDNQLRADVDGKVKFDNLRIVMRDLPDGKGKEAVVLNRNGAIIILDDNGEPINEPLSVPSGSVLQVKEGAKVKKRDVLAEWDPYSYPIITEAGGRVRFEDIVEGQTLKVESDASGATRREIMETRSGLHPQISILGSDGNVLAVYPMPEKAQLMVEDGKQIGDGTVLARTTREVGGSQDITGGLPRVTELFEARKPKDPAIMAEVDGKVEICKQLRRTKRVINVIDANGEVHEHLVPHNKMVLVHDGDQVKAGDALINGPLVPHDILSIKGERALQEYLMAQVQMVYRGQNVRIDDKHIETLIRQMLNKVQITDPGDTDFLLTDSVSKARLKRENAKVLARGGKPAEYTPILQGVARASLSSDSVIAAASFQETTRVLTDAAISCRVDVLRGLKENVLIGRLIPAGTGAPGLRDAMVKLNVPDYEAASAPLDAAPEDELGGEDFDKALKS
ncbi:MAG: DNA-directed RNA polymerase subunit beta' [Planctomycetes bacterium]|nr:DNA-directed RNA polymerase subunit beta' [Planctomycetota bacterium]